MNVGRFGKSPYFGACVVQRFDVVVPCFDVVLRRFVIFEVEVFLGITYYYEP